MSKVYMAVWYDVSRGQLHNDRLEAESLPEAKHKAFQKYCDSSGDRLIANLEIFEKRYEFECKGEINPKPGRDITAFAPRDYYTGMRIKRGGKDNGYQGNT